MKLLLQTAAACLLLAGCGYSPDDVDDFPVVCESCKAGFFDTKTTTIRCRADSVLITAQDTPCRHCGRMLAEPGDSVDMTMAGGVVIVTKRGRQRR